MPMYDLKTEAEYKAEETTGSKIKGIISKFFDKLQAIIIILALGVVLYLILVTPHEVDGRSMFPTYKDGQYLIANKLVYKLTDPKHGDVVIFKRTETQDYIKRVLAVPGDTIAVKSGALYVNDEKVDESEYLDGVITAEGAYAREGITFTVPEDQFFVAGDNRPHSSDSRAFGPIKREDIKGRAWFVFYPFDDFHFISSPDYGGMFDE